jgi:alkylhydroperoxidase family enzyme
MRQQARDAMPRLAPLGSDEVDDSVADLFNQIAQTGAPAPPIYQVLAHSPRIVHTWHEFSAPLRAPGDLALDLKELAVLRTAHVTGSARQWSHHTELARAAGVSDDKIEAVRSDPGSGSLSSTERLILQLADQLGTATGVDNVTFAGVLAALGSAQTVELIVVASYYRCLATMLDAFGLT